MKTTIMLTAMLFCGATAFAQDLNPSQVPSVVLNSFQKQFPRATDVEWELKGDRYEVEFDIAFAGHEVWLDQQGAILFHKEDIQKGDLPAAVGETISREFSSYRVSDIKKIQNGKELSYRADFEDQSSEWVVTFDSQGKVLQKTAD